MFGIRGCVGGQAKYGTADFRNRLPLSSTILGLSVLCLVTYETGFYHSHKYDALSQAQIREAMKAIDHLHQLLSETQPLG